MNDNRRFVIVRTVAGEKPKRMPGSGRRTSVCPVCARREVEIIDKAPSRRKNTILQPCVVFSGQRSGNRSRNTAYVPVSCRNSIKS